MAVFGFLILCFFGVVISFWFLAGLVLQAKIGAGSDMFDKVLCCIIFIVLCAYWRWLFSITPFTIAAA